MLDLVAVVTAGEIDAGGDKSVMRGRQVNETQSRGLTLLTSHAFGSTPFSVVVADDDDDKDNWDDFGTAVFTL